MSDPPTKNVYGTPGDTSFRKKYDREEYAARAAARNAANDDSKARYVGKHRRAPTPPSSSLTSARQERLNLEENLNKTTLVPAGASVGKRGKGAGFYCEACDLTFKDSLQWVDHLNSKQHLYNTGETGEVKAATLQDVRDRLDWLRQRKREEERERAEGGGVDLKKRLDERKKIEDEEARLKRERKKEKRKAAKLKKDEAIQHGGAGAMEVDGGAGEEEDPDAVAMARMMGFAGGFGSTKKR